MDRPDYLAANVPVLDLFRLDDRVAVVTGGAGLYGTQVTTALAEAGARVVIAARGLERSDALAAALRQRGLDARAMLLDLADESSIVALRDRVVAELGTLDVLVNNAVHRQGGAMPDTTEDDWEATSRVNSTALFLACKHVGDQMIRQRRGVILNVASIYGVVGPQWAIYEGTPIANPAFYAYDKGGMINFTRYLATYYAPHGIRANCVSPGGLGTDKTPPAFAANYSARTPLGRMAGPNDLKGAVVFLASDAAAYVTGINLMVDGGWTAQ